MASTLEIRVQNLEKRLDNLMTAFIQSQQNETPVVGKIDDTASTVESITPYKETKTGYIGDKEAVFMTERQGNLTVFVEDTDGHTINYTVERLSDRIIVSFEPLENITYITISII